MESFRESGKILWMQRDGVKLTIVGLTLFVMCACVYFTILLALVRVSHLLPSLVTGARVPLVVFPLLFPGRVCQVCQGVYTCPCVCVCQCIQ